MNNILAHKKELFLVVVGMAISAVAIYATPLRYTDLIEPSIRDIDPVTFYQAYIKNPDYYIFLDVRPKEAYDNLHAKGASNVPLFMLYDDRHILPKKGKEIILICSGDRTSGVAYSYLQHFGFTNISRIKGGMEEWIAKGLPTESSLVTTTTPITLDNNRQTVGCVPGAGESKAG